MSIVESVGVSVFMMVIVFLVLACLCLFINLFIKLIAHAFKNVEAASEREDCQTNKN